MEAHVNSSIKNTSKHGFWIKFSWKGGEFV